MTANYDLVRNWGYAYTTVISKFGTALAADKRGHENRALIPAGISILKTHTIASMVFLWQDQPNLVQTLNQVDAQTAIVCFRLGVVGNALVLGNNSANKTQ